MNRIASLCAYVISTLCTFYLPKVGICKTKVVSLSAKKFASDNSRKAFIDRPHLAMHYKIPVIAQNFWYVLHQELHIPIPNQQQIKQQKKYYLKHRYHLYQMIRRAKPYVEWIVTQIKARNMPMELILLPMVESAFDPQARSHKQAVGLWQLMPATSAYYGLIQNNRYDERRDVVRSTQAALELLYDLNQRFEGDWLLTLAAYNSGVNRVLKAIKSNRLQGKPIDYWSLTLPRETTAHVSKLLALSAIFKQLDHYGLQFPAIDHQDTLIYVDVGEPFTLTSIAEMTGLPLTQLKAFNPAYQQPYTSPNGPYHLMLPRGCVFRFQQALTTHPPPSGPLKHYSVTVGQKMSNSS